MIAPPWKWSAGGASWCGSRHSAFPSIRDPPLALLIARLPQAAVFLKGSRSHVSLKGSAQPPVRRAAHGGAFAGYRFGVIRAETFVNPWCNLLALLK
jgi:hypothetical protein